MVASFLRNLYSAREITGVKNFPLGAYLSIEGTKFLELNWCQGALQQQLIGSTPSTEEVPLGCVNTGSGHRSVTWPKDICKSLLSNEIRG